MNMVTSSGFGKEFWQDLTHFFLLKSARARSVILVIFIGNLFSALADILINREKTWAKVLQLQV